MQPLTGSFFDHDAFDVAHDRIACGDVDVRLTEVEAYRFDGALTEAGVRAGDTANHAPMWGPPGHLSVYLCYVMHPILYLVTGQEGHTATVLLRFEERILVGLQACPDSSYVVPRHRCP